MTTLSGHKYSRLTLVVVCLLLISTGCFAPNGERFAIYLTSGDIPPAQMEALSHVEIAEQPVISMNDIVSYDAQTHEIAVTDDAFDRIYKLEVPVRGRSFVACVNRSPIYWGAFWTPISSMSFDGVTIMKPLSSQEAKVIRLELGYPGPDFYGGEDPRDSALVMESLKRAGKLTNVPSAAKGDKLPHSMKGYELYSWTADDQWHFTLITGTNRNKTLEEIVSGTDTISQDGWVYIHVVGVDAIQTVLSRLPPNEEIFWLAGLRSGQTPQGDANITLPARPTIDAVKTRARQCGLNLAVQQP